MTDTQKEPLPCLVPKIEGKFNTFQDWVNKASRVLQPRKGSVGEEVRAVCVDAKGRRCHVGKDFHRARDEGCFPVMYFWECEADPERAALEARVMELEGALRNARELVEKWCHYQGDSKSLFDEYLGPIDTTLNKQGGE